MIRTTKQTHKLSRLVQAVPIQCTLGTAAAAALVVCVLSSLIVTAYCNLWNTCCVSNKHTSEHVRIIWLAKITNAKYQT